MIRTLMEKNDLTDNDDMDKLYKQQLEDAEAEMLDILKKRGITEDFLEEWMSNIDNDTPEKSYIHNTSSRLRLSGKWCSIETALLLAMLDALISQKVLTRTSSF